MSYASRQQKAAEIYGDVLWKPFEGSWKMSSQENSQALHEDEEALTHAF